MNNQLIVPVAVIILIGIIMAIIFIDRRDEKDLEEKLKEDYRRPGKQGVEIDEG